VRDGEPALLAARAVTRAFAGVTVLDGVDLEVRSGEVHALVGENGAGKTTLLMILAGALRPDRGRLLLDGREIHLAGVREAQAAGIGTVFQELSLVPQLSVAENVWANRAPARAGIVDRRRLLRDSRDLLAGLGCDVDPSRPVAALGMGARQLVEIAKALSLHARVLLLDEPTASLTPAEARILFDTLRRLTAQGLGVVFVSHRLEEVFEISDRISVLRDGRLQGTWRRPQVTPEGVVSAMAGRELSALYPDRSPGLGGPRLRLRGCRGPGVGPVDLEVRAGEILCLASLRGSGRTRLVEAVTGAGRLLDGVVEVDGRPVALRQPRDAIQAGIAYLPADRGRDGLFPRMSLADNVCAADLARVSRRGLIEGGARRRLADAWRHRLRIQAADLSQPVQRLSGGNQQKVLIAKCLTTSPRVLVVDEPTQGVDVPTKAEIHALLRELATSGLAVLMVSSELPEVLGMADRIAVMADGRVEALLEGATATEERVLAAAVGGRRAAAS
jgi:ABC-type sugar transport system ATPase subunit